MGEGTALRIMAGGFNSYVAGNPGPVVHAAAGAAYEMTVGKGLTAIAGTSDAFKETYGYFLGKELELSSESKYCIK